MTPTPQKIRRQRTRLACAAIFCLFVVVGLLVLPFVTFLWWVLFGHPAQ